MPDIVPLIVHVPVLGTRNVSDDAAVFGVHEVPPLTQVIVEPAVTKSASTARLIVPNSVDNVTLSDCPSVVIETTSLSVFVFPSIVSDDDTVQLPVLGITNVYGLDVAVSVVVPSEHVHDAPDENVAVMVAEK